jgi:hypothetical protein
MSSNGFDSSIPDEWVEEPDETEGEWKGCTKRFLAPIKINSRGSGEIAFATVSLYFCDYRSLFVIGLAYNFLTH